MRMLRKRFIQIRVKRFLNHKTLASIHGCKHGFNQWVICKRFAVRIHSKCGPRHSREPVFPAPHPTSLYGDDSQAGMSDVFHVQAMCLGHLHHGIDGSAGMGSAGSITEQPVLSADSERTNAVLSALSEYSHNALYPNKSLIRSFSPVLLKTKRFRIQSCG